MSLQEAIFEKQTLLQEECWSNLVQGSSKTLKQVEADGENQNQNTIFNQ